MGGGTPSLLDPTHVKDILGAIRETFNLGSGGDGPGGRKSGGKPPHSKAPASGGGVYGVEERPGSPQGAGQAPGGPYTTELEEVTLEADPETIEAEKAAAWVRAGIDRVSFGLQSFSGKELVAAGRMHRRAGIFRAGAVFCAAGGRENKFFFFWWMAPPTKEKLGGTLGGIAGAG